MSHVDLHLHLLPGVDDGPPDEAASLVHAERLAREGVHEATVTPHIGHPDYPLDLATIAERTRALQAAIAAAGIELLLHPGGEIHPLGATALAPDDLDLIAHGPGTRAGSCSRSRSPASTRSGWPPAGTSAKRASAS